MIDDELDEMFFAEEELGSTEMEPASPSDYDYYQYLKNKVSKNILTIKVDLFHADPDEPSELKKTPYKTLKFSRNLGMDLFIDRNYIDDDLITLAPTQARYLGVMAKIKRITGKVKHELEITRLLCSDEIRQAMANDPNVPMGGMRESLIKEKVELSPSILYFKELIVDLEYFKDTLDAAIKSLTTKNYAIMEISKSRREEMKMTGVNIKNESPSEDEIHNRRKNRERGNI